MAKNNKTDIEETNTNNVRRSRPIAGSNAAYKSPYDLNFDPRVENYFKELGYGLRWVRCTKGGVGSNERINYYRAVGGELVTPEEVKKIDPAFLAGLTPFRYRDEFFDEDARDDRVAIQKGDLLLMKIPLEYGEARRQEQMQSLADKLNDTKVRYRTETGGAIKSDFRIGSHSGSTISSFFSS